MGTAGGLRSAAQSAARRRPDLALARLNWPADADPSPGCGGSTHPECARTGRLIEERMLSAGVARPAPPAMTMLAPPSCCTAGGWPAPTAPARRRTDTDGVVGAVRAVKPRCCDRSIDAVRGCPTTPV